MNSKKILVITVIYDRIELTKKYLHTLKDKAGYDFKHVIVDNGSEDGSVEYLRGIGYEVIENRENLGIVKAWIKGYEYALKRGFIPDYICKFDNDCKVDTNNVLFEIMNFYEQNGDRYIVAPLDLNILPDYIPVKVDDREVLGCYNVRITTHTGGMFTVIPKFAFDLMVAQNEGCGIEKDVERGGFWRKNGYLSVYLNDLKCYHKGIGTSNKDYKF